MIKICGLHRPEDLRLARKLGADIVGMIYGVPESPRNNTDEELSALFNASDGAKTALLFRNSDLELVKNTLTRYGPDIVHLCGSENAVFRDQLKQVDPEIQIWQSYGISVESDFTHHDLEEIQRLSLENQVQQVVLDAKRSGQVGGTGCLLPISQLKVELKDLMPELIIAGGLNPDNLKSVLEKIHPKGVDASSGLESSPGIKDPQKLTNFIQIAKSYLK